MMFRKPPRGLSDLHKKATVAHKAVGIAASTLTSFFMEAYAMEPDTLRQALVCDMGQSTSIIILRSMQDAIEKTYADMLRRLNDRT